MAFFGDHSSQAGGSDPVVMPAQSSSTASPWNPFSNSLTASLTLKLDRTNFLSWKSQVVPTVIGHDLDNLLFSNEAPLERLINVVENPQFLQWRHKDQLLLSWLRSSMTEGILATVACYNTSNSVWRALEQKFASQSKARLLQLKSQLTNLQKGNMSISDYVDKIKSICDSLAIAGHPVHDFDLVLHLLNGLGPEFDSVISSITSRSDTLSLEEVQALLISHESRLEKHSSVMDLYAKMAANLTVGSRNGQYRSFNGSAKGQGSENTRFFNRTNGSRPINNNRPLCQVCMKFGHTAITCHYRFDRNWVTPKASAAQPQVNLTEQSFEYDPQAFVAQFVPDFGDDVGCMWIRVQPIILLSLLTILSRLFPSLAMRQSPLLMDKETGAVFLKGKIKDGLYHLGDDSSSLSNTALQVHLATSDISSLLNPSKCCNHSCTGVDSSCTKQSNKESCFDYSCVPNPTALLSHTTNDINNWHKKLGHPSFQTLSKILHKASIPCSLKNLEFCKACKLGKNHRLPYPLSKSRANQPLALVHTDLWGPSHVPYKENYKYYIVFVGDYSRFSWIFPLTMKSQAFETFIRFKSLVEKQFNLPIKVVQADGGGEYRPFEKFLSDQGIVFKQPCPHSHAQNGRVERKHRHITETGLTLLAQALT
uniref:Integrase catalytic domain-containing protein n=1 Tax=Cannabis sativa TaxID=3483 RepID=A0A803NKT0_CANSA